LKIYFSNCSFPTKELLKFSKEQKNHNKLRNLYIDFLVSKREGQQVFEIMKALCASTALEDIHVSFEWCSNIKEEEVKLVSEALKQLKSAKVKELFLDLSYTNLPQNSFGFIDISKEALPHLRNLDLYLYVNPSL
jgi:hypothetical protein